MNYNTESGFKSILDEIFSGKRLCITGTESRQTIAFKTCRFFRPIVLTLLITTTSLQAVERVTHLTLQNQSKKGLKVEKGTAEGFNAITTGFCQCKKCCGKWSGGPTKSGAMPVQGVTVAGPVGFKMGTRVWIEGVGVRVVQDRTAARYNGRWDVFFKDHNDARRFGINERKVKVIK